jgi:hypothetical protein
MRKIQLDLGNLRVESFAVEGTSAERGTVQGQAASVVPRPCTGNSCSDIVACICVTQDANCV